MDDFIFQEVAPIPEPSSLMLAALGLFAVYRAKRTK
jgi:hypothetical protein